ILPTLSQPYLFPYTTLFRSPYIDKNEIQEAKEQLPEIIFRQEFLAEFIESDGGVFRRVQEAAILTPQDYQQGKQYVAGVDVASRSEEHTSELQSRENLVCRL